MAKEARCLTLPHSDLRFEHKGRNGVEASGWSQVTLQPELEIEFNASAD